MILEMVRRMCTETKGTSNTVWLTLLDNEKEWRWGSKKSFDEMVSLYTQAIEALGRPLEYSDVNGKWRIAYIFNQYYRSRARQKVLAESQRIILSSLPYFFLDKVMERMVKDVTTIVAFKVKHKRIPRRHEMKEKLLFGALLRLHRHCKYNTMPEHLKGLLSKHGLLRMSAQQRWDTNVDTLRAFVSQQDGFPTRSSPAKAERQIWEFCATTRKQRRQGVLSPERIAEINSIPGFNWAPLTSTRYSRGPK